MSANRSKSISGRNGGKLNPVSKGESAPAGAGRKPNPFRDHIHKLSDQEFDLEVTGRLVGEDGKPTDQKVRVLVRMPGSMAIVAKAYKQAAKGDSQARKWLTETGWGKTFDFSGDDVQKSGGFVLVLPSNGR